jgi:hypothetical protein
LISAAVLRSVVKGEHPEIFEVDALDTGITFAYLENIASANDITVQALLSDSQYTSLLKTELKKFDNVVDMISGWENLDTSAFQSQLRQVYQGDEVDGIPDENIDSIRSMMDFISDAVTDSANSPDVSITSEDLLTGEEYAETLKEAAQRFGKTCLFMETSANCSDKQMTSNISNLYNGKNPMAYGLYEDGIETFKGIVDKYAKERNVTSSEFLSNSQYAEDVKKMLSTESDTKIIGQIYLNQSAQYTQEVCKNIYNAKIDRKGEVVTKKEVPTTVPTVPVKKRETVDTPTQG